MLKYSIFEYFGTEFKILDKFWRSEINEIYGWLRTISNREISSKLWVWTKYYNFILKNCHILFGFNRGENSVFFYLLSICY